MQSSDLLSHCHAHFCGCFCKYSMQCSLFSELFMGKMKYVCRSTELCILRHFLKWRNGKWYHFLQRKHPLKRSFYWYTDLLMFPLTNKIALAASCLKMHTAANHLKRWTYVFLDQRLRWMAFWSLLLKQRSKRWKRRGNLKEKEMHVSEAKRQSDSLRGC